MMKFQHNRQQWPVGHGFFHTASIEVSRLNSNKDIKNYLYIYDCGSKGQIRTPSNLIKKQIANYAKSFELEKPITNVEKQAIDMLVLSHFHADHINGVPELFSIFKINKLVIPFIEEDFKIIMLSQLLVEGLDNWNLLFKFISDTGEWINENSPDTQIIEIDDSNDPQSINEGGSRINDDGIYLGNGNKVSHNSYQGIYEKNQLIWQFKFYLNKDLSKASKIVEALIISLGLSDRKELMSALKDENRDRWEEIRDFYAREFKNNQNVISLSMYSAPSNYKFIHSYRHVTGSDSSRFCNKYDHYDQKCGWLGTGDAELKDNLSYLAFENHFGDLLDKLDTVTIPHHGSIKNYNSKLGKLGRNHIITAPTNDPKGHHPSSPVLVNLLSYSSNIQIVTAEPRTAFFQQITGNTELK